MRVATRFTAAQWPPLEKRLQAGEERAWQEAVDFLHDRISHRYLDHAGWILDHDESGFAVLAIDCLARC